MFPRHIHTHGIMDTSICNFTSPGCLPEILLPSSNQGKEANAVSLLQQTEQQSSKRKCGRIPSDTMKLETIMTVGSTHLIPAASRLGVTHQSDGSGYQVMQHIFSMQREKYFSTPNCCSSHWESQGSQVFSQAGFLDTLKCKWTSELFSEIGNSRATRCHKS